MKSFCGEDFQASIQNAGTSFRVVTCCRDRNQWSHGFNNKGFPATLIPTAKDLRKLSDFCSAWNRKLVSLLD